MVYPVFGDGNWLHEQVKGVYVNTTKLAAKEIARKHKVGVGRVRGWVRKGCPHVRSGSGLEFDPAAVEQWLADEVLRKKREKEQKAEERSKTRAAAREKAKKEAEEAEKKRQQERRDNLETAGILAVENGWAYVRCRPGLWTYRECLGGCGKRRSDGYRTPRETKVDELLVRARRHKNPSGSGDDVVEVLCGACGFDLEIPTHEVAKLDFEKLPVKA